MNKRTVIKGLKKQQLLLESDKLDFNSMWLENTGTWLELAFNEDDDILKKFVDVRTMFIYRNKDETNKEGLINTTKEAYKPLMQSAIEKIKIVGLHSTNKENIFSGLNNFKVFGVLFIVFVTGAGLTEWIHKVIDNSKSTPTTFPNLEAKKETTDPDSSANTHKYKRLDSQTIK